MVSRQWKQARKWIIVWLVLISLIIGTASFLVVIYGFSFFTFRDGGTGSSPQNNPSDQQELHRR